MHYVTLMAIILIKTKINNKYILKNWAILRMYFFLNYLDNNVQID